MIEVLSLGLNNLGSITHGLSEVTSAEIKVITNATESSGRGLLVVPGTGHFGAAMREIQARGFDMLLTNAASSGSRKIFGVCLGMQLLFQSSDEAPEENGLQLIESKIERLQFPAGCSDRIPRVGWEEITSREPDGLLSVASGRDVYFSHSYASLTFPKFDETLLTNHCGLPVLAGFLHGQFAGFQFHPERSSETGRALLKAIVEWAGLES